MKRFSEISKSSLVRHWFDELPVGTEVSSKQASRETGVTLTQASGALWYLYATGAAQKLGKDGPYRFYKKLRNSQIADHSSVNKRERTIVRRKANVIFPQNFSADENARLIMAANRALKDQLRAKMDEILSTLAEVDELLKGMKSD